MPTPQQELVAEISRLAALGGAFNAAVAAAVEKHFPLPVPVVPEHIRLLEERAQVLTSRCMHASDKAHREYTAKYGVYFDYRDDIFRKLLAEQFVRVLTPSALHLPITEREGAALSSFANKSPELAALEWRVRVMPKNGAY